MVSSSIILRRFFLKSLLLFPLLLMAGWGMLALFYSNLPGHIRPAAAIIFGVASAAIVLAVRPFRRGVFIFLILFAILVTWWLNIPPREDRAWQPDVATLPHATFDKNLVTLHNIRNADYRSETDFTARHYDKTVDLDKLRTVDIFLVYWGSPSIAHTMLSFGFEGGQYICFSIETRKEKGEDYSALKGFFKQYELTYIMADERDVVRLRTNYRNEDVYLFRLKIPPERAKLIFLHYIKSMNLLHQRPEWYNALTSNCTTNIRSHTAPYNPNAKLDWRILINGYVDEFIYEQGALDQTLPLPELKRRSHINALGKAADQDADFSKRIREGLPGF